MKKVYMFFVSLLLSLPVVWANDTAGQLLPTGEIEFDKQPDILLQQEALVLSDSIAVDYLFKNTSNRSITTEVFFPLPPTSPLRIYYEEDHNFDFKVFVNDEEVPYKINRRISVNGKDVTRYFDAMGLDTYYKSIMIEGGDWDGTNARLREAVSHLSSRTQKEMRELGLLEKSCIEMDEYGEKCIKPSNQYQLAVLDYKQEVSFYWTQTFPASSTVHIRHTYVPSFYTNSVGAPEARDIPFEYFDGNPLGWKAAAYIVTTANNWQQPIEYFHLLVVGETGAAVSAYNEGKTFNTFVSKTPYLMFDRRDFVPTSEILFEINGTMGKAQKNPLPRLYQVDGPANVRDVPNGNIIATLLDGVYVWAYPTQDSDWWRIVQRDGKTAYTHRKNLVNFWQ